MPNPKKAQAAADAHEFDTSKALARSLSGSFGLRGKGFFRELLAEFDPQLRRVHGEIYLGRGYAKRSTHEMRHIVLRCRSHRDGSRKSEVDAQHFDRRVKTAVRLFGRNANDVVQIDLQCLAVARHRTVRSEDAVETFTGYLNLKRLVPDLVAKKKIAVQTQNGPAE